MSERPNTAYPDASRNRPWRRFRDLPIWSKLGVIMIVPTLATIVVGTNGLITHIDTVNSADRARTVANISEAAGDLVHELQDERVAAVRLLGERDEEEGDRGSAFTEAQQAANAAEQEFRRRGDALTDIPPSYQDLLGSIDGQLTQLTETRNQVNTAGIGIIATTAFYQDLIGNLISLRDLSAQLAAETSDTALTDRMRATVATSQAKEFLSQRRVVGHVVLIRGAYNPYLRTAYIGAEAGQEQALQVFNVVGTGEDLALMDAALQGPEARQSQLYQGNLNSLDSGSLRTLPWDADTWDEALSAHAEQMRAVEVSLDETVLEQGLELRNEVFQQVLVQSGALLIVLVLAILLAWVVARSMVRSLRDLRQGALSVAQYGLPQAVARLRDPSLSTQLSPDQVAAQIAEPLPVRTRDEFGQVAEAFNVVHMAAVRTAAEQAQLRSSVAAMFVNLARRSQILVDRLISQLDRLERGEEDPDRLSELFQLDHLATRMRRTDENLLVLAGADSTRVQRDPAPMIDVLRAAQSEVEQYTRIEFGVVDRDLEVAAHAVNDLVHLVAELLDNATVFSPPDTHVMVEARRVGDRAVLYVQDRGLGLSKDQLAEINERLAMPPLVDVAVSRMMGLVVVSRLAARHGVKVELRPAPNRGTIADVTLPNSVLVPRAVATRGEGGQQPIDRRESGEPVAINGGRGPEAPTDQTAGATGSGYRSLADESFTAPPAPFAPSQPGTVPLPAAPPAPPAPATSPVPGPPAETGGRPPARGGGRQLPAWSDLVDSSSHGSASHGEPPPNLGRGHSSGSGFGHNGANLGSGTGGGAEGGTGGGGSGPSALPRRRPDSSPDSPPAPRSPHDPASTVGFIAGPTSAPSSGQRSSPPLPTRNPNRPASSPPSEESTGALPQRPPVPRAEPAPAQRSAPPQPPARPDVPSSAAPPPWPPPPPKAPGASGETPPPTPAESAPEPATAGGADAYQNGGPPTARTVTSPQGTGPESGSGQPSEAPRPYTPPPPRPPAPVGDQTMELPIFRELESVWFRTRRPANGPGSGGPTGGGERATSPISAAETAEYAALTGTSLASMERVGTDPDSSAAQTEESGAGTGATAPTDAVAGAADTAAPETVRGDPVSDQPTRSGAAASDRTLAEDGWRTAADDGWRAASSAANATVEEMTPAGLPKRRPMAQLVPGGVDQQDSTASTSQRRSPEAVRGLLSAYHRGVQRGRGQATDDQTGGSGGSPSTQAGKEQQT